MIIERFIQLSLRCRNFYNKPWEFNFNYGKFGFRSLLGDINYISISKYFESFYYFDLELSYLKKNCSPSQSSCFI